jgi:uncharacterized protein with HEPN domain
MRHDGLRGCGKYAACPAAGARDIEFLGEMMSNLFVVFKNQGDHVPFRSMFCAHIKYIYFLNTSFPTF